MFLFKSDHERYPDAIIDTTAMDPNVCDKSWYHMAGVLNKMGVTNFYFHLMLLNPDLLLVDPYDENLSEATKLAIRIECFHNPWYYFRRVHRVPDGSGPLKFRLNRPTLSLLWCFFCGIDYALIMPRQNGKSVAIDGLFCWLIDIYYNDTQLFLLTKDDPLRVQTVERIKKTRKLLPVWLVAVTKKDSDNMDTITNATRGNTLYTKVGQKAEDEARKVGRGGTYSFTYIDEVPYVANVQYSAPSVSSATSATRDNNLAAGILSGAVYTTTAGKLNSKEGAYAYSFIYSGMFWNEVLYNCKDIEDAKNMVVQASSEGRLLVHGTFSHRQCGKTDQWLVDTISRSSYPPDEIDRDYLNKWTNGSEYSVLSAMVLEILTKYEMEPVYTHVTKEKYIVNYYIPEHEIHPRLTNKHHLMGLDTSEACGRDANGLVISDITNMATIATCGVSTANLLQYALWLADMLITYPKLILVIERKSSAPTIIDIIVAKMISIGRDPFRQIFSRLVDDHRLRPVEYAEICKPVSYWSDEVCLKYKSLIGFMTDGTSRKFLYNTVLNECLNNAAHVIKDRGIASQLKGLIIKNGRVDHLPDGHDDFVIALLLNYWFLRYSKNLQHYGINPLECLSLVTENGATLTEEEILNKKLLDIIKEEIKVLQNRLLSASSNTEMVRDEKILEFKIKKASELGDRDLNFDQIINEINDHKRIKNNPKRQFQKLHNARYNLGKVFHN